MEKTYTLTQFMEALKKTRLINPYHIAMVSDGRGEFPDGYELTEIGAERLTEELKNELYQ